MGTATAAIGAAMPSLTSANDTIGSTYHKAVWNKLCILQKHLGKFGLPQ